MKWLIGLLVLAMMLGPLAWLRPTALEQHQERLRRRARERGLQVKAGELPQSRRQRVRQRPPRPGAEYRLVVEEAGDWERFFWQLDPVEGWQDSAGEPLAEAEQSWLESWAGKLPRSVAAVERRSGSAAVYWAEQGEEAAVDALAEVLEWLLAFPGAGRGEATGSGRRQSGPA